MNVPVKEDSCPLFCINLQPIIQTRTQTQGPSEMFLPGKLNGMVGMDGGVILRRKEGGKSGGREGGRGCCLRGREMLTLAQC